MVYFVSSLCVVMELDASPCTTPHRDKIRKFHHIINKGLPMRLWTMSAIWSFFLILIFLVKLRGYSMGNYRKLRVKGWTTQTSPPNLFLQNPKSPLSHLCTGKTGFLWSLVFYPNGLANPYFMHILIDLNMQESCKINQLRDCVRFQIVKLPSLRIRPEMYKKYYLFDK